MLRIADGQEKLGLQLVKVCCEVAYCLTRHLAGFKVALLNVDLPHDGGLEAFKKGVCKILPCGAIETLVVLALVPRILDVLEEVSSGIYDLQIVITVDVWLSVKYLVANSNELKVLLMRLVFILQGFQGLSIALDRSKLLVRRALIDITGGAGSGMLRQIVECGSTTGRPAAGQVD